MGNQKIRSKNKTERLFQGILKKTLKNPEELTVSQWAEKYRELDESSNLSGKWSNNITPYLVEIMDSFNHPHIREIHLCKGTQLGGTEALINMLGWSITQNPSPTMIVYPTEDDAKDISRDRLQPALQKSKYIRERFRPNDSKELKLKFKGMTLYLRGAGSPSKLASKAIKYLFFDEIDKMGGASKKEAAPYNLALERTKTFKYTRKVFACSTPTLKSNYIWTLYEESEEKRHYFVPCPHCKEMIELKWSNVVFEKDDKKILSVKDRAATAVYVCQKCSCIIENKDKPSMLRNGEWKTVEKKGVGNASSVGYWINSLYSIFVNWEDAAAEFLKSKDDPEKLQNFVNSWLAEPWEDTKLKTSAELVLERQTENEEFAVPDFAKLLTGGIDVQENCLYWSIRAFGNEITSQNITHGQAFSFQEVQKIMNLPFRKKDNTELIVNLALMDSGDQTDTVYDFCADNSEWVLPCKGSSDSLLSHFKLSKVNKADSKAYGMQLVMVDTNKYKDMIAGRMRKKNGKGSWMVYKGCDEEYATQVTAEHKINVKTNNGKTKQKWDLKKSHADNHYLDTEVYCLAAADVLGVRYMHLEDKEDEIQVQKSEVKTAEENWIEKNESWI